MICAALCLAACGDSTEPTDDTPVDAEFGCETCVDGRADSLGLAEPSYLAMGVLEIVNTYDRETLDSIPHFNSRAASNIIAERSRIADFKTIRQLDEVPWVGEFALAQLADFAKRNQLLPYCGDGDVQKSLETCDDGNAIDGDACPANCQESVVKVHGFVENSYEALAILNLSNTLDFNDLNEKVSLDRRAARGIVAARAQLPIGSLADLDQVPYVASRAFGKLLEYAFEIDVVGYCGDNAIQANEACDDGNNTNGDGCNSRCSLAASCELGAIDAFAQQLDEVSTRANWSRSIQRGTTLAAFTNERNFPGQPVGARCFGIDPSDAPRGAVVDSRPATLHQVGIMFDQYANATNRLLGTEIDPEAARQELACVNGPGARFTGCRLDFEPDPWSGISRTFVESTDGQTTLIFESSWSE